MEWRFGDHVLDTSAAELRGPDGPVHMERLPMRLLVHLVENAGRVVSRDEANEVVWGGRFVADSALSTAIRQIRRALGDDGTSQRFVKTVHGVGFRFVAEVTRGSTPPAQPVAPAPAEGAARKPSHGAGRPALAVLRFVSDSEEPFGRVLATAIPAEIVSAISRTHWLHVIARGSSFRFDPVAFDPSKVAAELSVGYLVTGTVEIIGGSTSVGVELVSTKSGALIWSDRIDAPLGEVQIARRRIVSELLTALETEIPKHEALHARSLDAGRLDAWSHFHVGLTHMMRFEKAENVLAAERFREALALDPEFARAHAGLSLTHWQNAFMYFRGDRADHLAPALASAEQAVRLDPDDPFVAFNLGRAKWLEGDLDAAVHWLDRGITINPNHAHCHYSLAIIDALRDEPAASSASSEKAISLSPLDPLAYGFHGVRIASSVMLGDIEAAVESADRAVRLPGAHQHILFTAAGAYEIAGDRAAAERVR
ncbi:MAG: winged helix-turn-helix domain-containing protein, partial [Pseudomonadota bacterium]